MPVDDATRAKLAQALGMLDADSVDDRAAVAAAIVKFAKRSGLNWGELLAARGQDEALAPSSPLPDTPWRPAELVDGCPGSSRQHRGRVLAVRQCHTTGDRPGWGDRIGRWYATANGAILVDQAGRQYFWNEDEARAIAEAAEEGPAICDGRSLIV